MTEDTEQAEVGQGADADWAGAMAEQAGAEQAGAEQVGADQVGAEQVGAEQGVGVDGAEARVEQAETAPIPESAPGIAGDTELPPDGLAAEAETLAQAPFVTPDDAAPASFEALGDGATSHTAGVNLDSVIEIPVTLQVEIGHARISIKELLQLNQGSVVELDRLAGDPLDVLVNGTLVAHGEVVVVNEKFGIRLTDVISARERVTKLG